MNIEVLDFENINSLVGRFTIDFRKLSEAGIFVITGPTGSGKTSILDAISYALYGQTPRQQGNGSLNKENNELMNTNCDSCMARVTFSIKGKRYRVSTSQKRTKKKGAIANFGVPTRLLEEYDGEGNFKTIATKILDIGKWIEKETGLSYGNFKRCMMLAQGEFANFLKADEKDRAEVLSTITGTAIYEDIGNRVFEYKSAIEKEIASKNPLEVLPSESRQDLETVVRELSEKDSKLKEERKSLEKSKTWIENVQKIETEEKKALLDLQNAKEAYEAFSSRGDLDLLSKGSRASEVEGIEKNYIHAKEVLESTQKQLNQGKSDLFVKETELPNKQKSWDVALKKQEEDQPRLESEVERVQSELVPLERKREELVVDKKRIDVDITTEDRKLVEAEKELASIKSRMESLQKRSVEDKKSLQERQSDAILGSVLQSIKSRFSDWKSVNTNGVTYSSLRTVEEIERAISSAKEEEDRLKSIASEDKTKRELEFLEELRQLIPQLQLSDQSVTSAQQKIDQIRREVDALRPLQETQSDIDKWSETVQLLRKRSDIQDKLDELYRDFCEGRYEVCPCCGSSTPGEHRHPVQQSELQNATSKLQEVKGIHKNNQLEHDRLENEFKKAEQQLKKVSENQQNIKARLDVHLKQLAYEEIPTDIEFECQRRQDHLTALRDNSTKLQESQGELEIAKKRLALWKELEPLQVALPQNLFDAEHIVNELKAREESYTKLVNLVEKNNHDCALTQQELEIKQPQVKALQEKLQSLRTEQAEKNQKLLDVQDQIAKNWGDESSIQRTNRLNGEIQILKSTLQERESDLKTLQATIEEINKRIKSDEQQVKEKSLAYSEAETQFKKAVQDHLFSSVDEYRQALLDSSRLKQLQDEHQSLKNKEEVARRILEDKRSECVRLKELNITDQSLPEIEELINSIDTDLKQLTDQLIENKSELKKDDDAIAHNEMLKTELAPLQEKLEYYKLLFEILGNQKEGFKKYAQQITFDWLISCANRQLVNLTDRYTLKQNRSKNLGLQVIDLYQDAEEGRDCTNLSGGESFIVSLALALGLSQMSGSNTQIDTIFLDEGFGTLDSESLDKVLASLEQLKASGKLIGIISHVEQLRERISQNIRVSKKGNTGISTIEPHPAVSVG